MTIASAQAVMETRLGSRAPDMRGKVRDVYDLGDRLLIVATDRLSAYDSVLPNGIPTRGVVLTKMSAFWFERFRDIVPNHMISCDMATFPPEARAAQDLFAGRSMLVRKARRLDVECVARGYLAGSGFAEYARSRTVCGVPLPEGLRESDRLPEPIYTPATKAESGHDLNISYEETLPIVGTTWAPLLREVTLALYRAGATHAASRGIIIADTKFEFGVVDGPQGEELILIDECLTPDSSRFWPAASYEPGRPVPSLDKQIVRDWLDRSGWDHTPPAPALPDEIVDRTRRCYEAALAALTA